MSVHFDLDEWELGALVEKSQSPKKKEGEGRRGGGLGDSKLKGREGGEWGGRDGGRVRGGGLGGCDRRLIPSSGSWEGGDEKNKLLLSERERREIERGFGSVSHSVLGSFFSSSFSLPSSLSLSFLLLIWDLFKTRTAPQEDFSLLGKGNPAPSSLALIHTHSVTYTNMSESTVNAHLEGIISDFEGQFLLLRCFFSSSGFWSVGVCGLRRSLTLLWGHYR